VNAWNAHIYNTVTLKQSNALTLAQKKRHAQARWRSTRCSRESRQNGETYFKLVIFETKFQVHRVYNLMVQCPTSHFIWFHVLGEAGLQRFLPQADSTFREWWCSLSICQPKDKRLELATHSIACCRRLWLERNNRHFERQVSSEEHLIRQVREDFQSWMQARQTAGQGQE
jgi:hypothetical protein